jgi:amino acid transporter
MANRVWGEFAFIAIFAILNSALANTNAGVNAATRVLYAMGRSKTLPRPLAHISPRFRTPDIGIIFTMILGVVLTLWLGFVFGPTLAFALIGTVITIPILVVYMAACLAVPFFFLREHRDRFNVALHIILPAIPIIVLIFPVLAQFIPAPPTPLNLAGPFCAAWFVLGLIIVVILSLRSPENLARGTKIYLEDKESPQLSN